MCVYIDEKFASDTDSYVILIIGACRTHWRLFKFRIWGGVDLVIFLNFRTFGRLVVELWRVVLALHVLEVLWRV